MTEKTGNPFKQVAEVIVESEKSYWKEAGRLALIGAGVGLLAGGGIGFAYLGVTGFIIGAVAGLVIGGVGLPLLYLLA